MGLVDLNMVRYLLFVFQVCCFQGEWELYSTDSEDQDSALVTFLMAECTYGSWKHTSNGQIIHFSARPECMDLIQEGGRGGAVCCKALVLSRLRGFTLPMSGQQINVAADVLTLPLKPLPGCRAGLWVTHSCTNLPPCSNSASLLFI